MSMTLVTLSVTTPFPAKLASEPGTSLLEFRDEVSTRKAEWHARSPAGGLLASPADQALSRPDRLRTYVPRAQRAPYRL